MFLDSNKFIWQDNVQKYNLMMIVIPGYKSEKLNLMLHIELCQIGNCIMPQMSLMSTCIISMLLETVHSTNSNKARQDVWMFD